MSQTNDNELFGAPEAPETVLQRHANKTDETDPDSKPAASKARKPARPGRTKKDSAAPKQRPTGEAGEYAKFSAVKPAASLLPSYIRERRVNDATMRLAIFGCLGVLALVLVSVGATFFMALGAQSERDDAQNNRQAAQVEADRLKPIANYYDGLKQRQDLATRAMATDLDRAGVIDKIYASARGKVSVDQVEMSGQPPCQGPDPFDSIPALGCVNLTVTGSGTDVAKFVDTLNDVDMFSAAYSASMFGGNGANGVPVTVNYSADALTMRFVPEDQRETTRMNIEQQASAGATAGAPQ